MTTCLATESYLRVPQYMSALYSIVKNYSTNFIFETVETQRLNPEQEFSSIQQLRSFIEIDAYVSLLIAFNDRKVLYVSKGKEKSNSSFAPLQRLLPSKHRNKWILEYSHVKFSFGFKRQIPADIDSKKKFEYQSVTGFPVLIIDIDDFDGDWGVFERYNLMPNYLIWNPKKANSLQVGYVLNRPIYKDANSSFDDYCRYNQKGDELPLKEQSPTYQFHTLFNGFNRLFGGDRNFKLHIAKNPFAATSVGAICWTDTSIYSIDELVARYTAIDDEDDEYDEYDEYEEPDKYIDFSDIRNHIETEKEKHPNYIKDENSRNCQLFDSLRTTAYEVSDLHTKETSPEFYRYLLDIAENYNTEFNQPLTQSELKATTRSIVKYCVAKKVVCKYPSYQKRRLEKMNKVKSYMVQTYGITHRYSKSEKEEIAQKFELLPRTIEVYAGQIRKEHPNLKPDKTETLHKIKALRNANPPVKWREIAKMLDMSEDSIKKMYQRHG